MKDTVIHLCKLVGFDFICNCSMQDYGLFKIVKILRPICEEAVWRSRYNEELYRLYDEADLVTAIKITRLRWAGHVMRM